MKRSLQKTERIFIIQVIVLTLIEENKQEKRS